MLLTFLLLKKERPWPGKWDRVHVGTRITGLTSRPRHGGWCSSHNAVINYPIIYAIP